VNPEPHDVRPDPADRLPVRADVAIALVYPRLLGTYGDGGNAVVLQQRLRWRGVGAEIVTVEAGDPVPETCDVYLFGGGEDDPQTEAARRLGQHGPVHRAVERGAVVFAVCAGLQIVGTTFADSEGRPVPGLGLLDCTTIKTDEPRAVGELYVDPTGHAAAEVAGGAPLTGFENHGGRTRLGPDARPLGSVVAGVGNGDGTEGVVAAASHGRVIGTYLHGPALARNPGLADHLIAWVLDTPVEDLAPLDDHEADLLRADRLRAIEHGRTDGVADRTWRDRVLRRN
jgi:CobQ-like glutamine amidotransferase family enzyme